MSYNENIFPYGQHSISQKYKTTDSVELFNKNKKILKDWRWNTEEIIYNTNKQGARYSVDFSDDFNWSDKIVVFGCSYIFGIGVNQSETVPAFIEKKTNIETVNFGVPAGSNEAIFYNVLWLLSQKIQPKHILVFWTHDSRFVHIENDNAFTMGIWSTDVKPYEDFRFTDFYTPNIFTSDVLPEKDKIRKTLLRDLTANNKFTELSIFDKEQPGFVNTLMVEQCTYKPIVSDPFVINQLYARDIEISKDYKSVKKAHYGPYLNSFIADLAIEKMNLKNNT